MSCSDAEYNAGLQNRQDGVHWRDATCVINVMLVNERGADYNAVMWKATYTTVRTTKYTTHSHAKEKELGYLLLNTTICPEISVPLGQLFLLN